jgi:pimeloyl-ACP methyl ester carboxylesterase
MLSYLAIPVNFGQALHPKARPARICIGVRRLYRMNKFCFLVMFLCVVSAVDAGSPEIKEHWPRFVKSKCPFSAEQPLQGVECGYVSVPENRANPNGRTLRLAVVILRSLSANPEQDPLVFLSGGPGQRSVHYTERRTHSRFWKPFREKRDLIFFDQRGTGYSDPHFCKDLYSVFAASFLGLSPERRIALQVQLFQDCKRRMQQQGIDFSAYNSATSAQDLNDIRRALAIEKWNLLGVSYGTRLALTAMRDTPQGIRSVILDSVDPPNARIWVDAPARLDRSLNLVFDQCNADVDCARRYPNLKQEFYKLIKSLEEKPIAVSGLDPVRFPEGRLILDGTMLAAGIFQALYDYRFIPLIPAFVDEVKDRNEELIRAVAESLVQSADDLSVGLQYSVDCFEMGPFNPRSEIDAEQKRFPHLAEWNDFVDEQALCEAWHDKRAGSIEGIAVHSDIPSLVLTGEFDPITPPSYGKLAAATLTNSNFAEVPGGGHAVSSSSDCTRSLLSAFLMDPQKRLDTSCIQKLETPVRFTTNLHRNAGVYKLVSQLQPAPKLPFVITIGTIILILGSTLCWPAGYLIRRKRSSPLPVERKGRWLAGTAAFVALGFFAGMAIVIMNLAGTNPYVLAFGLPGNTALLLWLPWMEIVLAVILLVMAWLAWKRKWWSTVARIHYSFIALAAAAFCGILIWLRLLALP